MATSTFDELYGSKYLKAADLPDDDDVIATVRKLEFLAVGQNQEMKAVMTLKEYDKPLILNATNAKAMGKMFGTDWDDWLGKKITLYTEDVTFAGKTNPAIRIRSKQPKQPKPRPAAEINKELGFEDEEDEYAV